MASGHRLSGDRIIDRVDLALVVTEPTVTGEHDLVRLLDVADHFGIKTTVCINKYDLNPEAARKIEELCGKRGVKIAGRLPYHTLGHRGNGQGAGGGGDRRTGG